MSTATVLLGRQGPVTTAPGLLRGQFVIETANPFIAMGYPSAKPDRFFMAEIDVLWERDPVAADRILSQYVAMGGNHVMTGPVRADGYKGHFPDTHWFGRAAEFARFYRWLRARVAVSMVVMTDIPPYYDDHGKAFYWGAIARDFDPFYAEVRAEGVVFDRVVSQWEQWQPRAVCAPLFQWMAARFPEARRYWHNSVNPPHLSPGSGDEEERGTWESALRYLHGLYLQADTATAYLVNDDGRTPREQMAYDLWDMHRRAVGDHSPWGDPLVACDGQPMEVVYAEGTAYAMYHNGAGQAVATEWGRTALGVEGVVHSLDGLP